MKEQLITFETAKLAKEKGFDIKTFTVMNTHTHIIIRIKDIEETNIVSAEKRDAAIVSLVRNSKQISLDEKDIEEKAWSYIKPAENRLHPKDSDGYNEFEVYQAVKQALKDLL